MAFIVFEGVDGSGKSTLIKSLATELTNQAKPYILTREPGGTPLAEEIRKLLLRVENEVPSPRTELLLYEASRAQHVDRVILPALDAGKWVVCDRFAASSVAFQSYARGLPLADVEWLNQYAIDRAQPDLTVLLDLSIDESQRRLQSRIKSDGGTHDRLENEKRQFHEKVRQGYLEQARANPSGWLVLDATLSPTDLFKELMRNLKRLKWLES
jgi:dTMP kinase